MTDTAEGSIFSWENPDNIPSWFDNAIKKNKEGFGSNNNYQIMASWTSDKEGQNQITKANLGNTVYLKIRTINIKDKAIIKFQLFEEDLVNDDDKFPNTSKNKTISNKEIIKTVVIHNSTATIELKLEEQWESMIYDDVLKGFLSVKIELFWKATFEDYNEKVSNTLDVYYSKRYLYVKPPVQNYPLAELLTSTGETIVFGFGDALKVSEKITDKLDDVRFFMGARALKSGKLVTNDLNVIKRTKSKLYTYNLYTNDNVDETIKVTKASNFGFKNKYYKNGKVISTKGLSQIDYFTNTGAINNVAKFGKDVIEIWGFTDLTDIMFKDGYGTIPTPFPLGWAVELLTELVIKPMVDEMIQEIVDSIIIDFELAKLKGLEACKKLVEQGNGVMADYYTIEVYTPTLQKLLKGEFFKLKEIKESNDKVKESNINFNSLPVHTVFYREFDDTHRNDKIQIIDCIFINEKTMKL